MKFVYNLKKLLGPVSDNEQRRVSMIEEWNVQNTSVSLNEIRETNPLIGVYILIDDIDLFIICS